jgi:hypothetical protein
MPPLELQARLLVLPDTQYPRPTTSLSSNVVRLPQRCVTHWPDGCGGMLTGGDVGGASAASPTRVSFHHCLPLPLSLGTSLR